MSVGRSCAAGEHAHCSGTLKYADPADGTVDVSIPCACPCHATDRPDDTETGGRRRAPRRADERRTDSTGHDRSPEKCVA